MKAQPKPEIALEKTSSINYREDFAAFLIESERSAYTIKNYLGDLDAFAVWLKSKGNARTISFQGRTRAPSILSP